MATIRITNLKLRTIIGINDWERDTKQDVIINIAIEFDAARSSQSDDIKDTIDYKCLTKEIIREVEGSAYFLLEKLARMIMKIIMKDKRAKGASVRVDKPGALRFCDSVSVEITEKGDE